MIRIAVLVLLLSPLLPAAGQQAGTPGNVTIYHCTDGQGRLTISDVPCPKGQAQDARTMLRPQDPPPKPARIVPAVAPGLTTTAPSTRVIVVQAPKPLYECVTPDGERYTSETGDGRPRYVPLWTLGYPVGRPAFTGGIGRTGPASSGLLSLIHI
jgi:hypothetical protein